MFEIQTQTKQGVLSEPCEVTVSSSHVRIVVQKSLKVQDFHLKSVKSVTSTGTNLQFSNGITLNAKQQSEAENLLNQICMAIKEAQPGRFEVAGEDGFSVSTSWPFANAGVVEGGPSGSYAKSYAFACAYYQTPIREDVLWMAQEIWPLESGRKFVLQSVAECSAKDVLCLIDALQFNLYFESITIQDTKLSADQQALLLSVLKSNKRLKEVVIKNCSLSKDFVSQLDLNKITIDLSGNSIDDKVCVQFGTDLKSKPLQSLKLADCGMSKKGAPAFIGAIVRQGQLADTLQVLDLSGNVIGSDGQLLLCELLAQPNVIQTLTLSNCQIANVELLFGALMRGSTNTLMNLDISMNKFGGSDIHSFDQFIKSAQSLRQLNMSGTKPTAAIIKTLLTGLFDNYAIQEMSLILKSCDFGVAESTAFGTGAKQLVNLVSLDLSDNSFDDDSLVAILDGISQNAKLHTVILDKCLIKSSLVTGKKQGKLDLGTLLKVPNLKVLSLADNSLKAAGKDFLAGLSQLGLKKLNVSGNAFGDELGVLLARYVFSSTTITELECSDNGFTFAGWQALVKSSGYSKTLQSLKIPQQEVATLFKSDKLKTEKLLQELSAALNGNTAARSAMDKGNNRQSKVATIFAGSKDQLTLTQQQTLDKLTADLNKHIANTQDPAQLSKAKQIKTEVDGFSSQVSQLSYLLDNISSEQLNGLKMASTAQGRAVYALLNSFTHRAVDQVSEQLVKSFVSILEPAEEQRDVLKTQLTEASTLKESSVAAVMGNFLQMEVHSKCADNYDAILTKAKNVMFDRIVQKLSDLQGSRARSDSTAVPPRTDSNAARARSDSNAPATSEVTDTPSKGRKITTQQNSVNAELMGKLLKPKLKKAEVESVTEPNSAGSQSNLTSGMVKTQTVSSAPAQLSKPFSVSEASSMVSSPQLMHTANKDRAHLKAKRKPPTRDGSIVPSSVVDSDTEVLKNVESVVKAEKSRPVSVVAPVSKQGSLSKLTSEAKSSQRDLSPLQKGSEVKSSLPNLAALQQSSDVKASQKDQSPLAKHTDPKSSQRNLADQSAQNKSSTHSLPQVEQVSAPQVQVEKILAEEKLTPDTKLPEVSSVSDAKSLVDQMMEEASKSLTQPQVQESVKPVEDKPADNVPAKVEPTADVKPEPVVESKPAPKPESEPKVEDSPSLPPKPSQAAINEATKSTDQLAKPRSMFQAPSLAQIGSALRGSKKNLTSDDQPKVKEESKPPKVDQKKPEPEPPKIDIMKPEPSEASKPVEIKNDEAAPPILAPKPKTYGKPMLPTNVFDEMKKNMKPVQKDPSPTK